MEFTRATYRRAIRLAENEVYSRADILEYIKRRAAYWYDASDGENWADAVEQEDKARTEYFKALDLLGAIKDRAKREGKLK